MARGSCSQATACRTSRDRCAPRACRGYLITIIDDGVQGINNRSDPSQTHKPSNEPAQDFDDSADELWSLYGKEAKSHDEEWVKVLKEDMDVILIFVCASLSCLARVDVIPIPGWIILWCSHRV